MGAWNFTWDEQFEPRKASTNSTAGQQLTRSYEFVWDEATFPPPAGLYAIAALSYPNPTGDNLYKGASHPDYPAARCNDIQADPHPDDPWRWTITATYAEPRPVPGVPPPPASPPAPDGSQPDPTGSAQPAPWDRAPEIRVDMKRVDKFSEKDKDGKLIANTCRDLFLNPPPQANWVMVITSTRNFEAWSPAINVAYFNKTNADTWQGFEPGKVLISGMSSAGKTENEYYFTQVVTVVEINPDGWNPTRILDSGTNFRDSLGIKRPATDEYGERFSGEVLLDGVTGQLLPDEMEAQTVPFRFYDEISFVGV
jgi:hypothetical protein